MASDSSAGSGLSDGSKTSSTGGGAGGKEKSKHEDLNDQSATWMHGLFGVLFTLSKEKADASPRITVIKIVLEYMQLFFLIANPRFGWNIDESNPIWMIVSYVNFKNPLISQGYTFYLGILYTVSSVFVLSLILCVWVFFCFQRQRFPVVWPIWVLRLFVSVFFQVFYISSLGVFLVAVNCDWFGGQVYYVEAFVPNNHFVCLAFPHAIHLIVGIVLSIAFILVTIAITAADFELDLLSNRWLAAATSTVEVRIVLVRTAATCAYTLLTSLRRVQTLVLAISMMYACWSFIRWQPHFNQWMNHARAGQYGSLTWAGFFLLVLTMGHYQEDIPKATALTNTMLIGLVPIWLLVSLVSYLRFRFNFNYVIQLFKEAPVGAGPRGIYRWRDVQEVEMCSRICRTLDKDDDEKQDPDSVKLAERILKGGLAFYSSKAEMALLYTSFLIEVSHQQQAGHSQLVAAKNLNPSYPQLFAIFVREQVHIQAAQTASSGESSVDLVSYVEFQKNQRMLVRSHKAALVSTRDFWRLLVSDKIMFSSLSRVFHEIEESHARADKAYKTMLERYSSSSKVLRMYAHFLEEVKNDPWAAASYLEESEKLEEQQAAAESSLLLGGDGGDARNSPVAVINATGVIQMANKYLLQTFGYKRGDLDGKNVSCLMPQPFSGRHNTYLRNYLTTGKGKIIDSYRPVLGLHHDKYVFPTRVLVTKISGDGIDSVFMGVFAAVADDKTVVRVYVAPGGSILCADQRFQDWFGRSPSDIQGKPFHSMGVEQGQLEQLVSLAAETNEADLNLGKVYAKNVQLLHRYTAPVRCDVVLSLGGTENNRILIYSISRRAENDLLMITDLRGKIVFSTTQTAEMLNYSPKKLHGMNIRQLIAQPFGELHEKWMKHPGIKVPPGSCRGHHTVVMVDSQGLNVPVRCHIIDRTVEEHTMMVLTFESSTIEEGVQQQRIRLKLHDDRPGVVEDQSMKVAENNEADGHPLSLESAAPSVSNLNERGPFGQKQGIYLNRHLSSFIDVFRAARQKEGGTIASCTQLLDDLICIARVKPGLTYRVGVHPPMDESKFSTPAVAATSGEEGFQAASGKIDLHEMERQMLLRETRPALLRIDVVKIGHGDNAIEEVFIELYFASQVTGVVEISRSGMIMKHSCCNMHAPGPIFGVISRSMNGKSIRKFIDLPKGKVVQTLMAAKGKKKTKSTLKNSFESKAIGPLKILDGKHQDGRPLKLEVECISKPDASLGAATSHTPGFRYLLRIKLFNPKPTYSGDDFSKLVSSLIANYVVGSDDPTKKGVESDSDDSADDVKSIQRVDSSIAGGGSDEEDEASEADILKNVFAFKKKGSMERTNSNALRSSFNKLGLITEERSMPNMGPLDPLDALPEDGEGSDQGGGGGDSGRMPSEGSGGVSDDGVEEPTAKEEEKGEKAVLRSSALLSLTSDSQPLAPWQPNSLMQKQAQRSSQPQAGSAPAGKVRRASFQIAEDEADGEGPYQSLPKESGRNPMAKKESAAALGKKEEGEGGSDGGGSQSSGSEMSEEAGLKPAMDEDHDHLADFKRGKRCKKLTVLLCSQKAQSVLYRFRNHSIVVTLLLLCAHVGCFIALYTSIEAAVSLIEELTVAGESTEAVYLITLFTRVMSNIYDGHGAGAMDPALYGLGDTDNITQLLEDSLDDLDTCHKNVFLGINKLRRLNDTAHYKLRTIWEAPILAVEAWTDDVASTSHEMWINMTLWELGNRFVMSGREVMSNHWELTNSNTTSLTATEHWNFVIRNGPHALADAYDQMLDNLVVRCIDAVNETKNILLILLVVEAIILVFSALIYIIILVNRVGSYRFHIFSVFLMVPSGLLRALASKKVTIDGEEDGDEDEEEGPAGAAPVKRNWNKTGGVTTTVVTKKKDTLGDASARAKKEMDQDLSTKGGFRILMLPFIRVWRVLKGLSRGGAASLSVARVGKKHLVKSPFDSLVLMLPFLCWSLLIIIIYPISYSSLKKLDEPVATINSAKYLEFYNDAIIFWSHELCSQTTNADKAAVLPYLLEKIDSWQGEFEALIFSPSGSQLNDPHFNSVGNFTFRSKQDQSLFFRSRTCFRNGGIRFEGSCFEEGDPYYEISHMGLAAMIERSLEEATVLTRDSYSDLNLSSHRLDYLYRVGLQDLGDALYTNGVNAKAYSLKLLENVLIMNIVLLVVSVLLAFFFLFYMVMPHVGRTTKESKRIAELLSQLPPDMDVEGLVQQAIRRGGGVNTEQGIKGKDTSEAPFGTAAQQDEDAAASDVDDDKSDTSSQHDD